jgi:deazaflavin-dependent oxidoreductase (nitroreductase family)
VAYLKPPMFVQKVFNPLAMRFGLGGAVKLSVSGRRSGQPQEIPVIPVEHEGARYLVSTRGESAWVKNVRAAGKVTLGKKGTQTELPAVELPVEKRPPVIATYRETAGKQVETYWKQLPEPEDHPVFRLG